MPRKSLRLLCVVALLFTGCARRPVSNVQTASVPQMELEQRRRNLEMSDSLAISPAQGAGGGFGVLGGTVLAAQRYVAVSHKLEIVEPGSGLAKSIEAVAAYCGTIQCELLSSNVTNETAELSASGNVSVRVLPQDLNKFLDFVGKQGKISQHSTTSEDKTAAVIDVEAKIKNQTEFRDSLRKMLAKSGVSVADLLQIQEKLAEAQAELDSEATQRKVLANETEKVAVDVDFRAEVRATSRGMFAPVANALRESGGVLADSLAALITAIAAIIPWLIIIVPGIWFLVKAIRRFKERRRAAKAAAV